MSEVLAFSDPRVLRAIQLIWKEAALLDAKDYQAWEQMYTDDALYVIPIDPDTEDFAASLNMVYDDKRMRRLRVERMLQGYSPSAVAAARTVRVVSRFTVENVGDESVTLRSAQILNAFKRDKFSTIGAELTHEIILGAGGEDRIALKVARLIDSEDAVSASGFLL
ncbi:3-phenylpropionate/cinnamic acid dioxygenase small subunit [Mycobacterium frederiksbergense]|uniref:3-phenylpropionate/cinnamic acid dioxygenase small subunit n=1 Tax=Mycolicibacterium frederiksbergense TaxID=117567 RepID=A0ABT6KVD7_9MYCO|nr:aromatic-ring-hydroxylating dioxygenase subunit beta [Mycolicibacterium frederiksbergense]MDH6194668.1 3-phenylpropionate/cinnamic acid dioxygenase small subunit [Mycolicibacterium frederiksbergense]